MWARNDFVPHVLLPSKFPPVKTSLFKNRKHFYFSKYSKIKRRIRIFHRCNPTIMARFAVPVWQDIRDSDFIC